MRRSRIARLALAAACLIFGPWGRAAQACELRQIAELPVIMSGDQPLVELSVNGARVRFLIDTGSSTTLLTRAGAQALGLKPVSVDGTTFYGVGGHANAGLVRIREFKLGGLVMHNLDILVSGYVVSDQVVGVLGRDVLLSGGDLELDLAHNAVRLTKPKDCRGDEVAYWANSYFLATLDAQSTQMTVGASLNGQPISALLDSGAGHSIVSLSAARLAGVTPQAQDAAAVGARSGMGGEVRAWAGTFKTLGVGGEVVRNAKLEFADLFSKDMEVSTGSHVKTDPVGLPDMLLGADFMIAHRIYIAASQGKVYFTYNGGPMFNLPASAAR
jgi:clan AA aspartic protease (TIGR02281 family)